MLENLRRQLCRLCGQKGSVLKPLFETASSTSRDLPTASKIDMYLPIKVKLDDPLPFCICFNCLTVLNQWHELYTTCVAADGVLLKTFGIESRISRVNNTCTSKEGQDVETQTEEMPSDALTDKTPTDDLRAETPTVALTVEVPLESLTDETKVNEDICTHCGESKTGILQEDKLFKEEFDKSFRKYRNISYKCRFCYELFRNSAERKTHIAMCRQLSTICELCGHNVPCRKNLKRHKYEKHNASPRKYLCDKCYKFFTSPAGLKFHLQSIHGEEDHSGKYCCELCGGLFTREIYYHKHKRKHELGKVKTVFEIENFRQEVNSEDSETSVIYVCPVCQEKFSDMSSLAVHLTEKKKLKCPSCLTLLYSEKSLFLHVCKRWTCQYCSKSFVQRIKWMVHERWHTGEKPIKCRKCDQTFRTWQSRRLHESHHEPSFQCPYCGKSFRNKYKFKDHVLCHEGKEFSCHVCDKKFSGRQGLSKHRTAFHRDLKKVVCSNE
ncbi:hypothetical protein R5R35_004077 [Gryllus longicercus]|uniref:Zinc finger protein n=1 Tax=Gryllus longicercus TaxID=2509291 RepID=A0AAN9VJX3_9ORTH